MRPTLGSSMICRFWTCVDACGLWLLRCTNYEKKNATSQKGFFASSLVHYMPLHHAPPQKWASHPDVVYARPLIEAGAKVVSSKDGLPTWIAEVMVTKNTGVEEAIDFVNEVRRDILANVAVHQN